MIAFLTAFVVSYLITLLIIRYERIHSHITADHDIDSVQKFHAFPVPRVGGIGVLGGIIFGEASKYFYEPQVSIFGFLLVICSLPVFFAGLVEDLTKKVSIGKRILAMIFSAVAGGNVIGGWLTHLDIFYFDYLLNILAISWFFTCIAVAGVTNAFNLIDGYNGLVGMVSIIILFGLAYVADQVGDRYIMITSFAAIGAVSGFLIWNYPRGLVFLGDGGAYLIGFIVAELSVLIVERNHQVSPWFPLLLVFYPIFETIFTIFRRVVIGKKHPGLPDAAHLHQLIHRRVVLWAVGNDSFIIKTQRNSLTSPYLWIIASIAVGPSVLFWNYAPVLQFFTFFFACFYIWIYRIIYKSRFPKWLTIHKKTS